MPIWAMKLDSTLLNFVFPAIISAARRLYPAQVRSGEMLLNYALHVVAFHAKSTRKQPLRVTKHRNACYFNIDKL